MEPTEDLGHAFARLQQSFRTFLRKRLPDSVQADDLLQEIFLKALKSQQSGRRMENLTGWLYAAARTSVADFYRAQTTPTEVLDEALTVDGPDEEQMHREISTCLRLFIERLPILYRETLTATELHGRTMRALAEEQGVSISAIKSRAARGRAMLKAELLACCHIEMKGGWVYDYHSKTASNCEGKCGT
ncbi:MAG TPA: sigma-70 family RNA polymerase sigma factor [Cellvibrionaceae bacterium]